jgi:hypothetical protein
MIMKQHAKLELLPNALCGPESIFRIPRFQFQYFEKFLAA